MGHAADLLAVRLERPVEVEQDCGHIAADMFHDMRMANQVVAARRQGGGIGDQIEPADIGRERKAPGLDIG
jgi:hypothetical protein